MPGNYISIDGKQLWVGVCSIMRGNEIDIQLHVTIHFSGFVPGFIEGFGFYGYHVSGNGGMIHNEHIGTEENTLAKPRDERYLEYLESMFYRPQAGTGAEVEA